MAISYRQRGKKRYWDYRIFNPDGDVIASNSGFKTKREAVLEAQKIDQKLKAGTVFTSSATLYELWEEWYTLVIEPSDLAKSTKDKYKYRGKLIKQKFSKRKVKDIRHSEYQKFLNNYGKKVIRSQVSRLNGDIKRVIAMAKRDGLLLNDFTDGIQLMGEKFRKKPEDKYLRSMKDYRNMLIYLRGEFDYMVSVLPFLLYTLFKTGLRTGEGMAVCWSDVKWEAKMIYTYRRFAGDKQEFCPPKTDTSIRYVPIDDDLIMVLKYLKRIQESVLESRGIVNPEGFIFFDYRYGVPTNTGLNKFLKKCLTALNIDSEMTATGTRHTYGSVLLANGVDVWVVSKILGHKDIKQVISTYGHLLEEVIDNEYEEIRNILGSQRLSQEKKLLTKN